MTRTPLNYREGKKQRTAIGRAIVKEPAAFLFDEPLSNLDAALRVRTRVELAELHQQVKSTMVYIIIDQTEAITIADRIVIPNNCKIEQNGTPLEVCNHPASRFVAGFVGSPAMNFLKAEINEFDGKTVCIQDDGSEIEIPKNSVIEKIKVIGIRPEAVSILQGEGDTRGYATVVEHLGDRMIVYVQLKSGTQITAQDSGRSTVKSNDLVNLELSTDQIHFLANQDKLFFDVLRKSSIFKISTGDNFVLPVSILSCIVF